MQLNQINFAGYVGKDPKILHTERGNMVILSLCYTKKTKEGKEYSTWVQGICSGWVADAAKGIKQGDNVFVSGALNISKSVNNDKEYTNVQIMVNSIMSVGKREPIPQEQPINNMSFDTNFDEIPF